MAAYCVTADVQAEFRDITFTASSAVTSTEVTEFMNQATNEIDARLNSKYVTPITGAKSLEIMKNICAWLVADRVSKILDLQSRPPIQTSDGKTIIKIGNGTGKDARQMIEDIMDNKLILIDAVLQNSSGGINSFNVDTGQAVQFTRNDDQW